jgi:hypothetical protein
LTPSAYAHGFELAFERQNTLKLPPPDGNPDYPRRLACLISEFLASGNRVFYIATHIYPPGHEFIQSIVEESGFEPRWFLNRPNGQLIMYERPTVVSE